MNALEGRLAVNVSVYFLLFFMHNNELAISQISLCIKYNKLKFSFLQYKKMFSFT
ncbi:hypothetical protein DI53_3813 [Sphingobacterium deserti]|uniref:Uncharacterized protein n=1 Tax=Sphingobacterium deserti TaxID=1229276 RepID=A0A0B8T617_9SPHI|nr:hypothetical protein DI53_3813 [Sphingobacterium deserti]